MEKKIKFFILVRIFNEIFISLIRFYRYFISPMLGGNCRYFPSCSEYAINIIKEYGFFFGLPYIIKRITKCHPFASYGYDPIPKKNTLLKKSRFVNPAIDKVRKVRREVLYKFTIKDCSIYKEDLSKKTKHFGIEVDSKLICVATIIEKNLDSKKNLNGIQIRGMATLESYHNKGYGSLLLSKIMEDVKKQKKIDLIWCNARKNSIQFYINNNFTQYGNEFIIKDIGPHKILYTKI
jgi:putative membrane protein insertion efficiency factor